MAMMATLSLLASPLAACVCSHHSAVTVEAAADCHSHSHHQHAPSNQAPSAIGDADECSCAANSPAAVTGTETVKIQKHFAALPSVPAFLEPVLSVEPASAVAHGAPAFVSETSYSFKPSRAPPRL